MAGIREAHVIVFSRPMTRSMTARAAFGQLLLNCEVIALDCDASTAAILVSTAYTAHEGGFWREMGPGCLAYIIVRASKPLPFLD